MRLALRLVLPALFVLTLVPGVRGAAANGGDSIASAPQVPLGQHVVAGKTGFDFWRVALHPGDHLTIDYGTLNQRGVRVCILKPSVTDYTRTQSACENDNYTYGKSEVRFTATLAGSWIIAFYNDDCYIYYNVCHADVAYEATTTVHVYTHLSLAAPSTVRAGGKATLRGQLDGAANGNVQLQTRLHGHWQHLATVRASASGAFAYRARFRYRGTFAERAFFGGDSAHLACKSKPVIVRVV
jgi:hypothetical protein